MSGEHPFYEALEKILKAQGFDDYVEGLCERFYKTGGRPSIPPRRAAPDLTFLSALAHAKEPIATDIARALWHALDRTRHLYADRYWDILMGQLHTAIRRSLEMELQGWKPQSPWGKRIYADGIAKGIAKGEAKGIAKGKALGLVEGEAKSVLALLRMRRIALTRAERTAIRTCRDPRRLRTWLRLACTATTAAELFEPRRRAS